MKRALALVALCLVMLVAFSAGRLESQTGKQKALIVGGMSADSLQTELNNGWRVTPVSGASQQNGVGSWLVILER
jgi:hypothetical protein